MKRALEKTTRERLTSMSSQIQTFNEALVRMKHELDRMVVEKRAYEKLLNKGQYLMFHTITTYCLALALIFHRARIVIFF